MNVTLIYDLEITLSRFQVALKISTNHGENDNN